ncbi:SMP-30/gluconolactonase/LRE family protein [Dyadobacter tibetensis]|uniref:SMP-30/gluconolactonase/LRE family protein n=1 Tax=Dyadobacter tibetensis TaxID=1211851 RepID=UPI00046FC141|nr:SMP-30/gluconolactonase/LRE family protein [Dyadobacter tibetensis]
MKKISVLIFLCTFSFSVVAQKIYPTRGRILSIHPSFNQILDRDAVIEVLASGFKWAEGPVWIKENNSLLFSDVPANTIYQWNEKSGLSVFLTPSGYTGRGEYSDEPGSNGLIMNQKGELVACEHGDRRLTSMHLLKGGKRTLADGYEGKRFNSPNDVVQHNNASYYFTDPPYGLALKHNDPSRELEHFGVYRCSPEGQVSLQISDLSRPNGLAFSPDQKTLYVAVSDPEHAVWMSYPVLEDGSIGKGETFYDATEALKRGKAGLPDGLKVDYKGNLWASGPGGIWILNPEGKLLGRIEMDELTSNCAWGDDGATLYMTVNGYLCRVRTKVKGANW